MQESRQMSNAARLVTAEELERFPSDDNRYELVRGRVVRMTPVGFPHGRIVIRLGGLLDAHLRSQLISGFVVTEVGFKLASNPDTVRAPDIAFIRRERVPQPDPKGFLTGPPDLAIEVLSPDDRPREVDEKVAEYLTCGAQIVVVIDPDQQSATVFRRLASRVTLSKEDVLDLGDAVPDFTCRVAEIFA